MLKRVKLNIYKHIIVIGNSITYVSLQFLSTNRSIPKVDKSSDEFMQDEQNKIYVGI